MVDPYKILGLTKSASKADIKSAFRKLAKKYHPDKNKDTPGAQEKFRQINNAYALLSDDEKRSRFDRGEIDGEGHETYTGFNFGSGQGAHSDHNAAGGADFAEFVRMATQRAQKQQQNFYSQSSGPEDFFRQFMGGGAEQANSHQSQSSGANLTTISLTLNDLMKGGGKVVSLQNGRNMTVTLPKEIEDRQIIKQRDPHSGQTLSFKVRLEPHPTFKKERNDLRVEVPITLYEAVLGAKIRVPTMTGKVEINLPPGVKTNKVMRLKDRGLPGKKGKGSLLVSLRIELPQGGDADLEALMRYWHESKPYKVR